MIRPLLPLRSISLVAAAVAGFAGPVTAAEQAPAPVLNLSLPRPVQAVSAALGFGRQRLALVLGNSRIGGTQTLASAPRDAQAVASALRGAGFVVMVREDLDSASMRADLKEFRERLQPGGVGFIYLTALGAQSDDQTLLLLRDTPLTTAASASTVHTGWQQKALPLSEVIDALGSEPGSPRLLVVDAGYDHPLVAGLPQPGLAAPRLPPGVMALFGATPGRLRPLPQVAPLGTPPPPKAADLAATGFARQLAQAIATPRVSGPAALRATLRALAEADAAGPPAWLAGETDEGEELAEAGLLDSVVPQTPEEVTREAGKQMARQMLGSGSRVAGEQSVAEILERSNPNSVGEVAATAAEAPKAAGGAAGLAATAATVAVTAAGAAATLKAAEASAAALAVSAAAGAAQSAAGSAVALAARAAGGTSEAAKASLPGAADAALVARAAATSPPAVTSAAAPPAASAVAGAAVAANVSASVATNVATDIAAAGSAQRPAAAGPPATPATDGRTQRTGDRGERPVYQPRSNGFGYSEGDTFTYSVIDTWKGELTSTATTAIEQVLPDGRMLANGSQIELDPQGRLKSELGAGGGRSTYEPAQTLWWAQPQRGQRRDLQFTEAFTRPGIGSGVAEWRGSSSVGRPRQIELPGGSFEVLPIESSGWVHELLPAARSSRRFSRTVWYSPQLGHPVAIDIEDTDSLGRLLKRERVELLHAQTARNTP
jgi:hypothetical protein